MIRPELAALALQYPCPTCGAITGAPCTDARPGFAGVHELRVAPLRDAFGLGAEWACAEVAREYAKAGAA